TNTELRDKFNAKLTEMKDDGKLDEIKEYWYTHGDGAAAFITENGTGETIRVVTDSSFPPYDSKNGNEFTGMDMDIVREICNRLDYKVQFATVGFDSIIDEVSKGNYDVGASALSITEDRKAKVLFSECYESSELIVVTRA
ncbi:MAG: transporter substrate-binding domain-containing protein, partial [Candidatus Methanomethylophilaceae archaeon]|nr:transporter substrate-binding domain-containing protein [Candidatus Methanomethylophilaceae archaeon]